MQLKLNGHITDMGYPDLIWGWEPAPEKISDIAIFGVCLYSVIFAVGAVSVSVAEFHGSVLPGLLAVAAITLPAAFYLAARALRVRAGESNVIRSRSAREAICGLACSFGELSFLGRILHFGEFTKRIRAIRVLDRAYQATTLVEVEAMIRLDNFEPATSLATAMLADAEINNLSSLVELSRETKGIVAARLATLGQRHALPTQA